MKSLFKILIAFTGLVFMSSCVKVLDYDIPGDEKKIVVNGIITDYNAFIINVSKSLHILDRLGIKPVDNALVQLYEDDILVIETEEGRAGNYFSDFTGSYGHTYLLKVAAPGMKTATATCIIPNPVDIENVDTSLLINESYYYDHYYRSGELKSTIVFSDPEETENYYELEGTLSFLQAVIYTDQDTSYITGYSRITKSSWIRSNDPVIEYGVITKQIYSNTGENEYIYGDKILFSDRLINGKKYNLSVSFGSDLFGTNNEYTDSVKLDIRLKSVTRDYYVYMQLLHKHMQVINDPLSEPAQAYTNIENGLGILAGMSESVYRIEFNKTQKPE
ncbi:MAG: DUF4249 domain-containing protein [Bacteroidales bacterium]